jgi:predicted transcriptional regulator
MAIKRVQKKIAWTPADRARHREIREQYKDQPTIEQLIERGELSGDTISLANYVSLRQLVGKLRDLREESKLSLADVSDRSGMDKAMLSRLENGHVPNPGIETISRYLEALHKVLEWRVVDAT